MNYLEVVVKRSQYSKSQYLTSSYHAASGDRKPGVSNNSEDLVKRLPGERTYTRCRNMWSWVGFKYGSKRLAIINSEMQC